MDKLAVKCCYENEEMDAALFTERISCGEIVVMKALHGNIPVAVGKGCKTKVNANIGASNAGDTKNKLAEELSKLKTAVYAGADTVMDLSLGTEWKNILKSVLKYSTIPVGTVPVYGIAETLRSKSDCFSKLSEEAVLNMVREQAKMGVSFMTMHCGVNLMSYSIWKNCKRILPIVSKGGAMICRYMGKTGNENPFYSAYDKILKILKEYNVVLSLGDAFRPGCQEDANDRAQTAELVVLSELTERALSAGVQVIMEGPGHMNLHEITMNVNLVKRLCCNVPYYVLGPLPTDCGAGHDHITAAIGGAQAAAAGVDFLCYVTPSEHLCLPNNDDVRLGVIACKIAAHAGDNAKQLKSAKERDKFISYARKDFDWESIIQSSIDPHTAKRRADPLLEKQGCSMCGDFCAMKND